MSRDVRLYLEDILTACAKIQRYTAGLSREQFLRDERTYDAVVRNLLVIGEAAKRLPDEIRSFRSDIDWKKIGAMRDILVHVYHGIDDDVLWSVTSGKIPELQAAVSTVWEHVQGRST